MPTGHALPLCKVQSCSMLKKKKIIREPLDFCFTNRPFEVPHKQGNQMKIEISHPEATVWNVMANNLKIMLDEIKIYLSKKSFMKRCLNEADTKIRGYALANWNICNFCVDDPKR